MDAKAIFRHVDKKKGWIRDALYELVQQESPSEDPPAVNAAMGLAELWAREQGARAKRHKQREFGDVLELRFGPWLDVRPANLFFYSDTSTQSGQSERWQRCHGARPRVGTGAQAYST